MTLEDQLMVDIRNGREIEIERALLIVSGCDTEEKIAEYKAKLGEMEKDFKAYNGIFPFFGRRKNKIIARNLHDYFWSTTPRRCNDNGVITYAIDAQLSPETASVGNCIGLKSLYTAVGLRLGLNIRAFIATDHIASIVNAGGEKIAIEHTSPNGFGRIAAKENGHAWVGERGLQSLIAVMLVNRGNKKLKAGDLKGAFADASSAIDIDPSLPTGHYNRGLILERMGARLAAQEDYGNAIRLCPQFAAPLNKRGRLKIQLNDFEGAIEDLNCALSVYPENKEAFYDRAFAKKKLGDMEGAIADYNAYLRLWEKQ